MKGIQDYINIAYDKLMEDDTRLNDYIDMEWSASDIEYDLYDKIGDVISDDADDEGLDFDESNEVQNLLEQLDIEYNTGGLNEYAINLYDETQDIIRESREYRQQCEDDYWWVQGVGR